MKSTMGSEKIFITIQKKKINSRSRDTKDDGREIGMEIERVERREASSIYTP